MKSEHLQKFGMNEEPVKYELIEKIFLVNSVINLYVLGLRGKK